MSIEYREKIIDSISSSWSSFEFFRTRDWKFHVSHHSRWSNLLLLLLDGVVMVQTVLSVLSFISLVLVIIILLSPWAHEEQRAKDEFDHLSCSRHGGCSKRFSVSEVVDVWDFLQIGIVCNSQCFNADSANQNASSGNLSEVRRESGSATSSHSLASWRLTITAKTSTMNHGLLAYRYVQLPVVQVIPWSHSYYHEYSPIEIETGIKEFQNDRKKSKLTNLNRWEAMMEKHPSLQGWRVRNMEKALQTTYKNKFLKTTLGGPSIHLLRESFRRHREELDWIA